MMYKDASETRKSKSMESPLTPPKTPPETRPNAPPYDREREVKPLLPSPCISEKTPLGWNQPRFEGASLELVTSPTRLSRLQGRTLAQKRGQGGLEKIKTFFEYNIDSTIGEDDLAPWDQRQSDQSDQSSSDDSSDSSGQKDKSDEETRIEYEDGIGWEGEMIYHRKTNRPRDRCFRNEGDTIRRYASSVHQCEMLFFTVIALIGLCTVSTVFAFLTTRLVFHSVGWKYVGSLTLTLGWYIWLVILLQATRDANTDLKEEIRKYRELKAMIKLDDAQVASVCLQRVLEGNGRDSLIQDRVGRGTFLDKFRTWQRWSVSPS